MKIVWIMNECPLPANSGGRIGMFKRLEQIAKYDDVYLFYTYDDDREVTQREVLLGYCKEVYAYKRKKHGIGLMLRCLRRPFTVETRNIKQMQFDLAALIERCSPDIINVDFPHMCIDLLPLIKQYNIPIVLNEHNIEWQFYKQLAASGLKFPKNLIYSYDSKRLKHYEEGLHKKIRFSGITFVSDCDMQCYKEWLGSDIKMAHIPVGADARALTPMPNNGEQKRIIFVGIMSDGPNAEGAEWFAKQVMPTILSAYPKAKFYIVGKNPGERVKSLVNNNVVVTGVVDSVDEYYENADLVVIPLFHGGGVKVKLLEAMSFARPIVSTSSGVQGTAFEANKHLFVADDPNIFAEHCIKVLAGGDQIEKMVYAAYGFFSENYTWEKIGEKYRQFLVNVINK